MAIDKRKKIRKFTIDGEDIALAGHQDIVIQNASGYSILTGDIPNTTIVCLDAEGSAVGQYTTPEETGGAVSFAPTQTGLYTLVATRNGVIVWTKQINVDNIGVFIAGAGPINNYTIEELGLACKHGYFNAMFKTTEEWTYNDEDSILNNLVFIIEQLKLDNGVSVVDFRLKAPYTKATYKWNEYFAYLSSSTSTSFSPQYSSAGGYKYSTVRQTMMKKGDEVYMQATGIKPDGSTISGGIEFSKLFYTKRNGEKSGIYSYNPDEDSFTQDATYEQLTSSTSQTNTKFMKGYFAVATDIDIENFSASYYYTRATVSKAYVYTHATEYVEGTTYYGFYETLQDDGLFLKALAKVRDYLVPFEDYSSTGLTNTTYVSKTEDLVDILCVEQFTGLNRTSKSAAGVAATTMYHYNIAGEGTKIGIYDYENTFLGVTEWTRSTNSNHGSYSACCLYSFGYVYSTSVYYADALRVGFRFTQKQT